MTASTTKMIEQFVAEATRAGSEVYQATNPEEVITFILDIAGKRNMNSVVKSKSSIANLIGLRQRLQNQGMNVKETDIGEWIAQSKENTRDLSLNPEKLVEAARLTLRELYINADIGISEAQIAVAETGTCILASNEGNDRLVSLLPRLHITLIDQRDICATWEEAISKLRELYKDKQGWRMPSFITYVTGRNTTGDIPGALRARAQGPEEEHIVLVNMP
jgi:L-lactate dehydrogenase complex protein LldF